MLFSILESDVSIAEKIMELTILIMVLSMTFSFHEFSHAWVAEKCGDDTPRRQGRITLNPLAHIDPLGAIMMLLAGFGWAKPVQYNPKRYKRWTCERMISLAGVTANYITAIVASCIVPLVVNWYWHSADSSEKMQLAITLVLKFFYYLREYSFLFLAFNLLPVPPLDGYRFISTFIPFKRRRLFENVSKYSYYVFFALLLMGRFGNVHILSKIIDLVAWPFRYPVSFLQNGIYDLLKVPVFFRL